jgi:hypothetical protein
MPQKPSKINSELFSDFSQCITREEFNRAISSLRTEILALQNNAQGSHESLPDAPRPRIFHKKKEGQREKLSTTIDSVLFELIKQRQQSGQQLSHVLDSALWHYFGRPKLSFENDDKE